MTWVKRGGGTGTGIYAQGIPAPEESHPPRHPHPTPATGQPVAFKAALPDADDRAGIAPAYRPNDARAVRNNRIILDVIAHYVREGGEAKMSMLYPDALDAFGLNSTHLRAASQGQTGAGSHYQATADGGRFEVGVALGNGVNSQSPKMR